LKWKKIPQSSLRTEIENYLKQELVKVRTADELYGNDAQNKFRNNLAEIAAKVIGQERADKITELYMQKKSFEKSKDARCKEKSKQPSYKEKSKDPCCKPK